MASSIIYYKIFAWFSFTASQDPQLMNKFLWMQNLKRHFGFPTENRVTPRWDQVMSVWAESGAWVWYTTRHTISGTWARSPATENYSIGSSITFCALSEHLIMGMGHISFKITPYLGGNIFISSSGRFYFPVLQFRLW